VVDSARVVAKLLAVSVERLIETTTETAKKLFALS